MMDSLNGNLDIGSLCTPLGVGIERKTAWSRWCKNAAERLNSDAIIARSRCASRPTRNCERQNTDIGFIAVCQTVGNSGNNFLI